MVELVIFYIIGVYMLFFVITYFKINNIWAFVLASVIYPLYVEGLFTGIITFDISFLGMLSYFVGWHSTFAVIIGFYYHRKWLVENNRKMLIVSSIAFGILWGTWSIIYWTQKQINDPDFEDSFSVGQWSILNYSLLVIYLTIIYIISHYLLGRFSIWQSQFNHSKVENIFLSIVVAMFIILQILIAGVFVILLFLHFTIVIFVLNHYKNNRSDNITILKELGGRAKLSETLIFLIMPILAILFYSIFYYYRPSDKIIDDYIYNGIVFIQLTYGFILYITAIIKTWKYNT